MILVTGSTGFVGSNLVKGLTAAGHSVRALVRDKDDGKRIAGDMVEPFVGDVTDLDSMLDAADGCDAVIHLVGIIQPGPGYSFKSIHVEGTRNTVEAAKAAGTVKHFVYQSALGTRPDAVAEYHRTKYQAEEITKASGIPYTITRPSIIFGKGDGFTTRMTEVINSAPVVPILGDGKGLLQPVYINDLVAAFVKLIYNPEYFGRTLEIGGPDKLTFDQVIAELKDALHTGKPSVHVPLCMVRPAAAFMERLLPHPPVTNDQLTMLQEDNATDDNALIGMGITPVGFREGLRRFIG